MLEITPYRKNRKTWAEHAFLQEPQGDAFGTILEIAGLALTLALQGYAIGWIWHFLLHICR